MTTHIDRNGVSITAGYRTFTGYRMTQAEADAYNRMTDEIVNERWPQTQEFLKDQRHRLLVMIATQGATPEAGDSRCAQGAVDHTSQADRAELPATFGCIAEC